MRESQAGSRHLLMLATEHHTAASVGQCIGRGSTDTVSGVAVKTKESTDHGLFPYIT